MLSTRSYKQDVNKTRWSLSSGFAFASFPYRDSLKDVTVFRDGLRNVLKPFSTAFPESNHTRLRGERCLQHCWLSPVSHHGVSGNAEVFDTSGEENEGVAGKNGGKHSVQGKRVVYIHHAFASPLHVIFSFRRSLLLSKA